MAVRIALRMDLVSSNHHLRCNDKINKRTAASFGCGRSALHVRVATTVRRQTDCRLFIAVHSTVENSNILKKLQFTGFMVRKVMTFQLLSVSHHSVHL